MSDTDIVEDAPPEQVEKAPVARPARAFKVKEFINPEQLKKDMTYSLADLSDAMLQQAPLFAHYGTLAAKASRQVDDLKMLLEITEAKVYRVVRDEISKTGAKSTEAQLEKTVAVHPQVIAVKKALNEAKQIEATAKTAAEGFRHRRDMLVQQGLISREEMKGELSISRRNEAESQAEAAKERVMRRLASD